MALATPEPATGIVDDTDRRQLLRNVQTNKAGHRAPPLCQPPGTVPGPRQYEWNWLPTAITRCPHMHHAGYCTRTPDPCTTVASAASVSSRASAFRSPSAAALRYQSAANAGLGLGPITPNRL